MSDNQQNMKMQIMSTSRGGKIHRSSRLEEEEWQRN